MQWDRSDASSRLGRFAVLVAALLGTVLLTDPSGAQQPTGTMSSTRLFTVMPAGGKAGSTVEITLTGPDIEDPLGLIFSHPGIKAELLPLPPPDPKQPPPKQPQGAPPITSVRYKVAIPAEVPLGIHDVRLFNKWGVSNPRAFVIGDLNEAIEKEPNSDIPDAQRIELNTTVNGVISAPTDVDYVVFAGKKGQRVVMSCLASSIDSRLQPVVELYNTAGQRLATNRDYNDTDALVDATLPADGDYYVRVFQFTYTAGSSEHYYRLSVTTAPWIDAVFPPVVEPGKAVQLTIYGRNLPDGKPDPAATMDDRVLEKATVTVNVPNDPAQLQRLNYSGSVAPAGSGLDAFEYRLKNASGSSNAIPLFYARAPLVVETGTNNTRDAAQKVPLPCEVVGRLDKKRPQGWYAFSGKKGETYVIEAFSDRMGSPTELSMVLYNADTKQVVADLDDDPEILSPNHFFTRSSDPPRYRLTPTADTNYLLLVRSMDSPAKLGPRNFYRVRIAPDQPDFRIVALPASTYMPEGHLLRQGSQQELSVYIWRQDNFTGEIELTVEGLPNGIISKPQVVGTGMKSASMVLTVAPDAPEWTGAIRVKGAATINGKKVEREARAASIIWPNPIPQGNQPGLPTFTRLDRGIYMAVRGKGPFTMNVTKDEFVAQLGDKITVPLKLERNDQFFKGPVNVVAAHLPANLTFGANNQAQPVPPDKSEASFVLDVKANVIPGTYSVVFRGTGLVPFTKDPKAKPANVNYTVPSTPVLITVLPKQVATVTVTPPNPMLKLGTTTELTVKVARQFDYTGEFKIELVQPANAKGISAAEAVIPAGKDEVKLVLNVAADAPPGNRPDLLIRATAMIQGKYPAVQDAKLVVMVAK